MKITHIVVHYSATYPEDNTTAADIDRMHKARGWKGIGYHWFIRRDGTVEQGRPESQVGAHVAGQNTGKIGICWAGGIDKKTGPNKGVFNMTKAQNDSLVKLIKECLQRYPGAIVLGHRDLAQTQCPGFDVRRWWAAAQNEPLPNNPVNVKSFPIRTRGVIEQVYHVVQPGDTLWNISRMYGLEFEDLLKYNGWKSPPVIVPEQYIALTPREEIAITTLWGLLKAFFEKKGSSA